MPPLKRPRIAAVAAQDRQVQGNPLGVCRHCQDNLGPIGAMIAAMTIASEMLRPLSFEIDTGQVIKDQAHALGKGLLIELLFQPDPMAVELIHRAVEIVLLKRFLRIQSAGGRQPRAPSLVSQRQLGAGEEQPTVDDGLE